MCDVGKVGNLDSMTEYALKEKDLIRNGKYSDYLLKNIERDDPKMRQECDYCESIVIIQLVVQIACLLKKLHNAFSILEV